MMWTIFIWLWAGANIVTTETGFISKTACDAYGDRVAKVMPGQVTGWHCVERPKEEK